MMVPGVQEFLCGVPQLLERHLNQRQCLINACRLSESRLGANATEQGLQVQPALGRDWVLRFVGTR